MITLDEVIEILNANRYSWLYGSHQGNDGNQGNTLEGLLGVKENNLSLPDLGEIELKTQKVETSSFLTLFHKEPKPRASIPKLLKCLGWRHQLAGGKYSSDEMSFRSTTFANRFSDRGFSIRLASDRIEFIFDPKKVNTSARDLTSIFATYGDWLVDVEKRLPHYSSVLPVFWSRCEFEQWCIAKLDNTLLCTFETRRQKGHEMFKIVDAKIFKGFQSSRLETLFNNGDVAIDFDARTRHNHGTKLRVKKDKLGDLFEFSKSIF